MAEKALAAVIQEAYAQGISTRSVDHLVKAMDMDGISKSQVSRLCGEIDEKVQGFLNRPLEGLIRMETVPRGLLKRQWRTATPRPCLGVMRRDHDQQPTPGHTASISARYCLRRVSFLFVTSRRPGRAGCFGIGWPP